MPDDAQIIGVRTLPSGIRLDVLYGEKPYVMKRGGRWYKADCRFNRQKLDQCYFCGLTFADYDGEYEADCGENGVWIYAAKCGVCEACARAKSATALPVFYPYIVRKYERRDGRKTVAVHEYSDGCVVEGVEKLDLSGGVKEIEGV